MEDGTARLRTRNGYDYTSTFPELAPIDRGFDNCIIDGEVCPVRKDGITDFSGLQAAMKAGKTAGLVFFAFDLLLRDDQDDPNRLMMVATDTRLRRENDT